MTEKQKIKRNPANIAKSYLADYSAAAVVGIYYALQEVVSSLPDLPQWVVGVMVVLAVLRALALQWLVDRDGDGVPDRELGLDQLQEALAAGKLDAGKVKELAEKHSTAKADTNP